MVRYQLKNSPTPIFVEAFEVVEVGPLQEKAEDHAPSNYMEEHYRNLFADDLKEIPLCRSFTIEGGEKILVWDQSEFAFKVGDLVRYDVAHDDYFRTSVEELDANPKLERCWSQTRSPRDMSVAIHPRRVE